MEFNFNQTKLDLLKAKLLPYWERAKAFYRPRRREVIIGGIMILIVLLWILPPASFPKGRIIRIQEGATVREIGAYLEDKKVVQSELLFTALIKVMPGQPKIIAGDYMLNHRLPVLGVIYRLMTGSYGIKPIAVRIPEGATVRDIGIILDRRLPEFDRATFLTAASSSEGYLFPDTYLFLPTATEDQIIDEMRENFDRQIDPLRLAIFTSGKTLDEVVTMASIIEKEGITTEDRGIISGILWKRIEEGMRLQVDAVFPYFLGKNTFTLTRADLRNPSPYNTYRYAGLPPGPIGSPSLDSLRAAVSPIDSPYWFYLSDLHSEMHYAVDYKEHLSYKNKYLPWRSITWLLLI